MPESQGQEILPVKIEAGPNFINLFGSRVNQQLGTIEEVKQSEDQIYQFQFKYEPKYSAIRESNVLKNRDG